MRSYNLHLLSWEDEYENFRRTLVVLQLKATLSFQMFNQISNVPMWFCNPLCDEIAAATD